MAINYSKLFNLRKSRTPQSQAIAGSTQVANNAGGFAWAVDDWMRLDRFLILGAEGGTYYVGERDLIKQNHDALVRCIQADGARVVKRITEVSDKGLAPKNDPAIFALALAAAHGDAATKKLALESLPKVCRIGTHLFHFGEYVNALRGWGRGLRRAVADWYVAKNAPQLALQAVKYQQRDGWSHRDMLRLAHPRAKNVSQDAVFRWMVGGTEALGARRVARRKLCESQYGELSAHLPPLIAAFEEAKLASTNRLVELIVEHDLPREAVPTEKLKEIAVWEALLEKMPMTAMIRNLGKMTNIGLVKPLSAASKKIVSTLNDESALKRARAHPLAVLRANKIYAQGRGDKGKLAWKPVQTVVDALDGAFYATFQNVEPCGKPMVLALDVSGSMTCANVAGSCLTAREGSAALALITAATESDYVIVGFSAAAGGYGGQWGGGESGLTPINISPRMRLAEVIKRIEAIPMGGTDCALPMVWARRNRVHTSAFVTYTDSETWAGKIHPSEALRDYRSQFVADSRMIVVGMASNGFSIADPNDRWSLDVVGFDASVPAVIADFIR